MAEDKKAKKPKTMPAIAAGEPLAITGNRKTGL